MLAGVCLGGMGNSAKIILYCYVCCVLVGTSLYEIFTGTLHSRSVAPGLTDDPYSSLILCLSKALLLNGDGSCGHGCGGGDVWCSHCLCL